MSSTSTGRVWLDPARHRARFDDRLDLCRYLDDGTDQVTRHGDDMSAEVLHYATADRRIEPPMPRRVGAGHVVLGVDAAERDDVSDLAAGDDLAGQRDHGVLQIVEADLCLHAGLLRGIQHPLGDGAGRCHRFLEVGVLAGGDRGQRHLGVELRRRRDADDVDLGVRDQLAPVPGRAREAQVARSRASKLGRRIGQDLEHRRDRHAEHRSHVPIAPGVGLAHEARTDQTDVQCFHLENSQESPRMCLRTRGSSEPLTPALSREGRGSFLRPRLRALRATVLTRRGGAPGSLPGAGSGAGAVWCCGKGLARGCVS